MKKYSAIILLFFLIGNLNINAGFSDIVPSKDSIKKYGAPVALLGTTALAGSCLFGAENFGKLCTKALTTPLIGLYTLCAYAGPKKVIGAASAAVAGTGIYHRWYFYNVDNKLNNALNTDLNDSNFLFSAWQINQWQEAFNIKANKDNVKQKLKALDLGVAKEKNGATLVDKITAEKELFKKWIRYVGSFTDFPAEFVKAMKSKKTNLAVSDISDADNALGAAAFLKDYNINFDNIGNACVSSPQNTIIYATQWRWWNPTQIALFPFYDTATQLCKKLISYYGRLCVFEQIAKEIKAEPSARDQVRKQLLSQGSIKVSASAKDVLP